ncbi:YlqF/YawG family GTPase [Thermaerobacter subterraneus]|uniref:Ribosome biogenesis GTPase A n=1 Tax=Thermaerobacter subterraneus DSM 13965 TaxID=867903 RepID=K6PYT3_9FIRM|nr:GTPase [Thermaerobacter subterraneus]EKP93694.1 putative GTPase [Thermaerobacter subterraneus DSM 13965]
MAEGGALKGHMARALRQVRRYLEAVDAVVEVADARAPFTSRSPQLAALMEGRLHLLVLSRGDLADPATTRAWVDWFSSQGIEPYVGEGPGDARLVSRLRRRLARAPAAFKPRVLVAGLPNVGKSTLLNSLAGRRRARVGAQPGVTRGKQWVDLGSFWLMDTPGVLPPHLGGTRRLVLGALGLVGPELAGPEEIAAFLLKRLGGAPAFRQALGRWGVEGPRLPAGVPGQEPLGPGQGGEPPGAAHGPGPGQPAAGRPPAGGGAAGADGRALAQVVLEQVARQRGLLGPGGQPDIHRAAAVLVAAFRAGELGRFSLEHPRMLAGPGQGA